MTGEHKAITGQAFILCGYATTLIFLMIMYALYCGHDGLAVSAGAASIAGLVAGASGFTIGRITK